MPLYYSYAAFDHTIGPTCTVQVAPVGLGTVIPTDYETHIRACAVYQPGVWKSLVVINAMPSNISVEDKPSLTIRLGTLEDLASQTIHLSYLTNQGLRCDLRYHL